VLHHVGLAEALRAVAFVPQGTEMRHWRRGHLIASNPLGEAVVQRYGFPYYHVHRADLIAVLARAAAAHPAITLHTGARVSAIEEHADGVRVLADGATHEAQLLVGADGIHSAVRSHLFGEQAPSFTGNVAWRALVPAASLPPGLVRPMSTVWWGPGKHFVHYYVRGGELVNCVCVVEKQGWELESWNERGEHAELRRDFAGWHASLQTLIDAMDPQACYKWALFDRPPLPQWGRGRVTLMGDACHPTLPFMAQGAAMAIEDAAVLARHAAHGLAQGKPAAALTCYADIRRPRTSRIQAGSRRNATVFHLSGIKAWLRNRAVARARGQVMDALYRHDALADDTRRPA
jgi:salicylate hydroxylase